MSALQAAIAAARWRAQVAALTPKAAEGAGGVTLVGDALAVLKGIPDRSVHMCVTSPPYFGLRDYKHPDQIGLEKTPAEYIARLVAVFAEVRRVLRDDATCWINLGDSYAANRSYQVTDSKHIDVGNNGAMRVPAGLKPKDLVGIPWRVAFALQDAGWWLRSDIVWHKPNAMPESVTDRPTKAHEYVFMLAKSERYFYDADAIRDPASDTSHGGNGERDRLAAGGEHSYRLNGVHHVGASDTLGLSADGSGRNKRSVWSISTVGYPGAHFATFPPKLVEPMILAGTSERGVCPACAAPWVRVVERTPMVIRRSDRRDQMGRFGQTQSSGTMVQAPSSLTTGWRPSCTCQAGEPHPAIVLDPFIGSGTTGMVAGRLGRRWVGIELHEDNAELARERTAPR